MKLNSGQILDDRYQIQRQLSDRPGRKTYLALDLQTQTLVVLKLMYLSEALGWDDFKLFEREAQVLQVISHPAIPQYLDSFDVEPEKGLALVQTYIKARSLAEYLQARRSFTQAEVEQIAQDLLNVLIYLHELHPPIIHRDLKPSNILLGDRSGNHPGQVYLIDFGSVRTSMQTSGSMTIVGTFGYMPFEQFQGQATPVSDLYSLGMTLIHLVTGIHPADLSQDDFQVQDESLAHVEPIFASWLQWLTQRNPKRRPQSAQIALQALTAISATPPAHAASKWRWDGSQWLCLRSTRIIQKPLGSKVILTKSEDVIDIKIPNRMRISDDLWGGYIVTVMCWAILVSPFIAFFWVGLTGSGDIVTRLFVLICFGIPTFGIIRAFIEDFISRWSSIEWRIDRRNFIQEYRLFGLCWRRSESRNMITKVTYHPTFYRDTEEGRVKEESKLILHKGIYANILTSLMEVELEWLAFEINDWLDSTLSNTANFEAAEISDQAHH